MLSRFKSLACLIFLYPLLQGGAFSSDAFPHSRWDKLLKSNVTQQGWVNYQDFRTKDAADLKLYLKEIANANPSRLGNRNDQKAFWINAYNAICIQTIMDHGVPAQVPHAKIFGANIFTQRNYKVAGKLRSLDDIEHGILRKQFKDKRVHAALVCGASSCPRLRSEAYTGARIDEQLQEEAKSWITVEKNKKGERKNYIDRAAKIYYVSKILYWYQEDFGDSQEGVLAFLKTYVEASDREFLQKNKVKIKYLSYDWSVNKE